MCIRGGFLKGKATGMQKLTTHTFMVQFLINTKHEPN
jgi:hypothetical protein